MKKIFLRNGLHLKKHIIQLIFPYDGDLKELVKRFPECGCDGVQKCLVHTLY